MPVKCKPDCEDCAVEQPGPPVPEHRHNEGCIRGGCPTQHAPALAIQPSEAFPQGITAAQWKVDHEAALATPAEWKIGDIAMYAQKDDWEAKPWEVVAVGPEYCAIRRNGEVVVRPAEYLRHPAPKKGK